MHACSFATKQSTGRLRSKFSLLKIVQPHPYLLSSVLQTFKEKSPFLIWYFYYLFPCVLLSSSLTSDAPKDPPKRKPKRRRGPDIVTDIPLNENEHFKEVTITRHKKRLHTASKPVYIPLPPTLKRADPALDTVEHDGDLYSDTEGAELLPATRSREHKGPSRSVSVSRTPSCLFFYY